MKHLFPCSFLFFLLFSMNNLAWGQVTCQSNNDAPGLTATDIVGQSFTMSGCSGGFFHSISINRDQATIAGLSATLKIYAGEGNSNQIYQKNNVAISDGDGKKTFTDASPFTGANYYRLKQMDYNGDFSYSPVVSAQFRDSYQNGKPLVIFPNPVKEGELNVNLPTEGGTLLLFDATGRQVLQESTSGSVSVLDLTSLAAGIYWLQLVTETHRWVERVVVH